MRRNVRIFVVYPLLVCVLVAALSFAGLVAWVMTGPRSLDFLTPRIEEALSPEGSPFTVKVGDTLLKWDGWKHPFDLSVRDVHVIAPDGAVFANFPEVSLTFYHRYLLVGEWVPSRLTFRSPSLTLYQTEDGTLQFGFGGGSGEQPPLPITALLALVDGDRNAASVPFEGMLMPLKSIAVEDARLRVGTSGGAEWFEITGAQFRIKRTKNGISGTLDIPMRYDEQAPARVLAVFTQESGSEDVKALLNFERIAPAMLARLITGKPADSPLAMPLTGEARVQMDLKGKIKQGSFSFAGDEGSFSLPEQLPKTLILKHFQAKGMLEEEGRKLTLEDVGLAFGESGAQQIKAHAVITREEAGYRIDGTAEAVQIPLNEVQNYWPLKLAPHTREWVVEGLLRGTVSSGKVTFAIKPGDLDYEYLPDESIAAEVIVEGGEVSYLPDHPVIKQVQGVAHFTGHTVTIDIARGTMLSGTLIEKSRVSIPDVVPDNPRMGVELNLNAPAKDVASLLNQKDIDLGEAIALKESVVSGQVKGKVALEFNMFSNGKKLKDQNVTIDVDAALADFSHPKLLDELDVESFDGTVKVKEGAIEVEGAGRVNTVPATVALTHRFKGKPEFPTHYTAKAVLPASAAKKFDITLPEWLSGILDISLTVDENTVSRKVEGKVNAAQAAIDLSTYGYRKAAGVPAAITFSAAEASRGGPLTVSAFTYQEGANQAAGSMQLAGNGDLARLAFTRLKHGASDLALTYSVEKGRKQVNAKGAVLDLGFYFSGRGDLSTKDIPDMAIEASLGKVMLANNETLHQLVLSYDCTQTRCARINATGKLANGKSWSHRIVGAAEGGRSLETNAADAGAFLRTFGVLSNLQGGALIMKGTFDDAAGGALNALLEIQDFELINAPVLTKILSIGSLSGMADTLQGKGVSFTKLQAPLTLKNDVITLSKAKAYGPSLGITADGTIALKGMALALEGTIVPSYTLNSLVGKIPLVGEVLVGGEGQGLIAANYSVKGPYANADVRLNPLSILTPGFLRGLFDIFDSDTPGTSNKKGDATLPGGNAAKPKT